MRIESTGRAAGAATARRTGSAGAAGFGGLVAGANTASRAAGVAPAPLVNGLLPFAELEDAASGRSRGLARGHELLDMLDDLRRALVLGGLSVSQLQTLAARARNQARPSDPLLGSLLDEIELRVEVELAKYDA